MMQGYPGVTSVEERLDAEISDTRALIADLEAKLPLLEQEHREAENAEGKAWDRIVPKYDRIADAPQELRDGLDQAKRFADIARARWENTWAAMQQARRRIKELQDPVELERRKSTSNHMREVRKMANEKKQTARDRGVPDVYLGENGNFRTGMDARYKSDLVSSALGLITKEEPGNSLQVFEVKDAEKRLQERGWTGFLERKREILDSQKAKKAEAQKKREETARERAAEKEQKAAEKKAAAEAKKAESDAAKAESSSKQNASKGSSSKSSSKTDQLRQMREEKAGAKS